jgi:class 3 adenylate cyclase
MVLERPGDSLRRAPVGEDYGAVAMIDALGFKGIWEREDPGAVLHTLDGFRYVLRDQIAAHVNAIPSRRPEEPNIRVRCISDTVLVVATAPDSRDVRQHAAAYLETVACLVAAVLMLSRSEPVPLLFRGAIAVGTVYRGQEDVLGPAIDEAAENMEIADGAFIWLAPSALTVFRAGFGLESNRDFIANYRVPINRKGGGEWRETAVVNPLGRLGTLEAKRGAAEQFLRWFDRPAGVPPDVVVKKQNTAQFLEAILQAYERSETPGTEDASGA